MGYLLFFFFFSSRRRHTRFSRDWSSDVCSSDLDRRDDAASLLEVTRSAHRRRELERRFDEPGELLVAHGPDGLDGKAPETRQVEVDIAARQAELVQVGTYRSRGKALVAQFRERARAVALRELRAVFADDQAVMDVHRRLGAESPREVLVESLVGEVVLAPDDVGDSEVDVVYDAGQVVGRTPVRAEKRDAAEPDRPLFVHGSNRPRSLPMALGALALAQRALVPPDSEPFKVPQDPGFGLRVRPLGIGVVYAQNEDCVVLVGKPAVDCRCQGAAEVKRARRARREADANHRINLTLRRNGNELFDRRQSRSRRNPGRGRAALDRRPPGAGSVPDPARGRRPGPELRAGHP